MARSANVSARVDPEIKVQAEAVMDELGIPASVMINMLYKQIIRCHGIPFSTHISQENPSSIDGMTMDEIHAELDKGYQDVLSGRTVPLDVFHKRMQHIMQTREQVPAGRIMEDDRLDPPDE